jgi:ribonuclease VapC
VIVVDTSAIVAILRGEPEAAALVGAIAEARLFLLSSVTYVETYLVLVGKRSEAAAAGFAEFLVRGQSEVVPFDRELADEARRAFVRFGKGRHPAALNFGDCAAYALAKARGLPLLYKGGDFARTDIRPALP